MATRINGDNVRVPGYVFLENPLIGVERALATGPNGEIISTNVTIGSLELLNTATTLPEPNSLVKRDGDGKISDLNYHFVQTSSPPISIGFGEPPASLVSTGKGSMTIPANSLRQASIITIRFVAFVSSSGTGDVEFFVYINGVATAFQFESVPLAIGSENYGNVFEGHISAPTVLTGLPVNNDIHAETVVDEAIDITVDNTFAVYANNATDGDVTMFVKLLWMEVRHAPL